MIRCAGLERGQLSSYDAGAIHDTREAVARAQREHGGSVREDGRSDDGRQYRERIASNGVVLQGRAFP